MTRANRLILAALFVASAAAWFLLTTLLSLEVPDAALVAVGALGAAGLSFAGDASVLSRIRQLSRGELALTTGAGMLAIFLAPLLVLANRFTDAPPGSEVLFFTTAVWGVLCVAAGVVVLRRAASAQLVLAFVGLLGVAVLLANWERPSSFSPFVRYPRQELWFLAAGIAWAVGVTTIARMRRRAPKAPTLVVATVPAAVVAVVWAVAVDGMEGVSAVLAVGAPAIALAVAVGALVVAWFSLVSSLGQAPASGLWFLPAIAITGLGAVEQVVSPRGPDPVVWPGAISGMALAAIAAVALWLWAVPRGAVTSRPIELQPQIVRSVTLLGLLCTAAGAVSLVLPAFDAAVQGTLSSGEAYTAQWQLLGFESGGGWAPLLAGGLLLSAALTGFGAWEMKRMVAAVSTAVATIAAYPWLASTPLHTWNRFVPVEVQSEYGTEYALIEFSVIHSPVRLLALAAGALGAVVLIGGLTLVRRGRS